MTISRRFVALLFVAALTPVTGQEKKQNGPDVFTHVRSVVAIGDIHGDPDALLALLRQAGLIGLSGSKPSDTKWTGRDTHLVLTGDFVDRGPNSAAVIEFLMALEPQAQRAGGRLHALIGNHEAMNMYGDLRYVSPEDFASYRTKDSEKMRTAQMEAALEQMKLNGMPPADEAAWRTQFLAQIPLGWVEQRLAFLPEGKYGKWLLKKNSVVRINDALFLHGGISQKYVARTLKEMNDQIRLELSKPAPLAPGVAPSGMSQDEEGPLWYRGLAQLPENDEQAIQLVGRVLETQVVNHIVIGHTPDAAIMPRFGGKVITIDVGLSRAYESSRAFLLMEDGKYYAVHRGRKLDLPVNGGTINEYLGAAALLEPPESRLRTLVDKLSIPTAR